MIRAVLPSGEHAAAPWRPQHRAGSGPGAETARRALLLFQAQGRGAADVAAQSGAAPAEWAYVPAADMLLTVGEGLVGVTIEGVFADGPASKQRLDFGTAVFQTMMST